MELRSSAQKKGADARLMLAQNTSNELEAYKLGSIIKAQKEVEKAVSVEEISKNNKDIQIISKTDILKYCSRYGLYLERTNNYMGEIPSKMKNDIISFMREDKTREDTKHFVICNKTGSPVALVSEAIGGRHYNEAHYMVAGNYSKDYLSPLKRFISIMTFHKENTVGYLTLLFISLMWLSSFLFPSVTNSGGVHHTFPITLIISSLGFMFLIAALLFSDEYTSEYSSNYSKAFMMSTVGCLRKTYNSLNNDIKVYRKIPNFEIRQVLIIIFWILTIIAAWWLAIANSLQ